jgi:hypothetical protein
MKKLNWNVVYEACEILEEKKVTVSFNTYTFREKEGVSTLRALVDEINLILTEEEIIFIDDETPPF